MVCDQFAQLHLSHGLGLLDSLIAATAVGHGSALNTFNDRHYRMFAGLTIVRPYRRWRDGEEDGIHLPCLRAE
jgi:predicted nucleic acid-binding protein